MRFVSLSRLTPPKLTPPTTTPAHFRSPAPSTATGANDSAFLTASSAATSAAA